MRIKIVYEYDGSSFCGSQSQKNGVTVQDVIESALFSATLENIRIYPSGRTDTGVSAENQVAHFDTQTSIPPDKIYLAVNRFLPSTVKIKQSAEIYDDFHARFGAKSKTYVYKMYMANVESPIRRNFYAQIPSNVDVIKMIEAGQQLIGEHDFAGFMSSGSNVKSTIRTILDLHFETHDDEIYMYITADGFLYNMVRIIVGTLLEIGLGGRDNIKEILTSKDRKLAGKTAKANGLTLVSVRY